MNGRAEILYPRRRCPLAGADVPGTPARPCLLREVGQAPRRLIRGKHPGRSSQEETVGSENPRPGVLMSTLGKVRRKRATSHRPAVGNLSDRRSMPGGRPDGWLWWRRLRLPRAAQEDAVADVEAHITGTVWKIECQVGDEIEEGDTVVILESMKMEMPVEAEDAGTVKEILCEEGQAVNEGDTLVVLE
jgi:acetyl-CoA carboxylase biotin carboxyl carrier protein